MPSKKIACLEHFPDEGGPARRVPLRTFPFRIGRSDAADLTVYSRRVSNLHVEVLSVGERYLARDLGSTNGIFVNGNRLREGWLQDGDVLHVASKEFRFTLLELAEEEETEPTLASPDAEHQQLFRETNDLVSILESRAVAAVFQPIVRLSDQCVVGYETLGRVAMPGSKYSVGDIFRIAHHRGESANLARTFRAVALKDMVRAPERPISIFINLHPAEMRNAATMDATFVRIADASVEGVRPVMELHEAAVTDPRAMMRIRARLQELDIGLAYDDFGAGQSRLMELVEVPPDYLKLDMALVRDIDRSQKRQDLVGALVSVMSDLGIEVLAEGIERGEEGVVCRELGCKLGQGYHYGRPAPFPT